MGWKEGRIRKVGRKRRRMRKNEVGGRNNQEGWTEEREKKKMGWEGRKNEEGWGGGKRKRRVLERRKSLRRMIE